ncbi:MAG: WG repeat-containing protein [Bacteroidetes bacterium]|nr:WG repeat-containing protein [Bacteroidota bacterium]
MAPYNTNEVYKISFLRNGMLKLEGPNLVGNNNMIPISIINKSGEMLFKIECCELTELDCNLFIVCKYIEGKSFYGVIDYKGNEVIKPKYDGIMLSPTESGFIFSLNEKMGIVDFNGVEVFPAIYNSILEFKDGLAAAELFNKWGFIDARGNVRIPFEFEDVNSFHNELAMVKIYGKWGFINKSGEIKIKPTFYDNEVCNFSKALQAHRKR